jgi:hypothetical protein
VKILYHCPHPNDAGSFYRGVGPLSCLRHIDPTIQIEPIREVSWAALAGADVVFLQRPYAPEAMDIARLAKTLRIPLIVDYDDNLFAVPRSHGDVYRLYQRGPTQQIISAILSWADVVTVTNENLRDIYSEWTSHCVVVPNAYNDYWLPTELPAEPRERTIFWRGSTGHIADLATFADDLVAVARDFPDWKWSFMGAVPWPLEGAIPGMEYRSPVDIFTYHHVVRDLIRPSIMIAPLRDIPFNHGRSDLWQLEAASFGADVCGGSICKPEFFKETLQMKLSHLNEQPGFDSWNYVRTYRLLSYINHQRLDILRSL